MGFTGRLPFFNRIDGLSGLVETVRVLPEEEKPSLVTLAMSDDTFYWRPAGKDNVIRRASIDLMAIDGIAYPDEVSIQGLAPAGTADLLFLADWGGRNIWRSQRNGAAEIAMFPRPERHIAVDSVGDNIYWATDRRIHRATLDHGQPEILPLGERSWLCGLVVDADEGKIYWKEGAFDDRAIWRANLDGSAAEHVISEYLSHGYPIGSGVAEGACRHLVKDRMERTGMRWRIAGAQAMLNLRAVHINDEWEAFQRYHTEYEQAQLYPYRHFLRRMLADAA